MTCNDSGTRYVHLVHCYDTGHQKSVLKHLEKTGLIH